jgi:hypothetical protein
VLAVRPVRDRSAESVGGDGTQLASLIERDLLASGLVELVSDRIPGRADYVLDGDVQVMRVGTNARGEDLLIYQAFIRARRPGHPEAAFAGQHTFRRVAISLASQ